MFTRDSRLWNITIAVSLVIGALSVLGSCDPHLTNCAADATKLAYYGIPDKALPFLRLAALVLGTVSGVMKTSPLPHSIEGDAKITPSGR